MEYIDRTILTDAADLVTGSRGQTYGPPAPDHDAIGLAWTAVLSKHLDGHVITGEQVALCLIGMKLVRESVGRHHRDNLVDLAGYVLCYDNIRRSRDDH